MKRLLTPRYLLAVITGLFFAAYSAYNVFIIIRDFKALPMEGILISAVVALLFAVLSFFMWTAGIKGKKHVLFMTVRRWMFIVTLTMVFALKIRLVDRVIAYLDPSQLHTVLYVISYFMTQAAFLILIIYYTFIIRSLPFHPKAAVALPVITIVLLLCSLLLEAFLFFVYGILLEANTLRTLVIRPIFYLGFIGMSLHFLYPLRATK